MSEQEKAVVTLIRAFRAKHAKALEFPASGRQVIEAAIPDVAVQEKMQEVVSCMVVVEAVRKAGLRADREAVATAEVLLTNAVRMARQGAAESDISPILEDVLRLMTRTEHIQRQRQRKWSRTTWELLDDMPGLRAEDKATMVDFITPPLLQAMDLVFSVEPHLADKVGFSTLFAQADDPSLWLDQGRRKWLVKEIATRIAEQTEDVPALHPTLQ